MAKALPIAGIVGSVFAALSIAVLVPDTLAMFVPVLVTLACAFILVLQRSPLGVIAGLVLLALTVVAGLGLVGTVSTQGGGETDLGLSVATGQLAAIAACLLVPIAAVALRWGQAQPRWLAIAGLACAVVAFLIAAADPGGLAQQNQTDTLVAAVLALLASAAMVPLLRAEADDEDAPPARPPAAPEAAPLASAESSVGKAPAPAAGKPGTPGRRP